jgi:predicted MFS family arabinose efflux permease
MRGAAAVQPTREPDAPLPPSERARGRRLAIASHPAGMTFRMVFTAELPTLALVALGASEAVVGLQRAFLYLAVALQLPALRLVSRVPKRSILVGGQLLALAGSAPLLFFGALETAGGGAIGAALAALLCAAVGMALGETVWFALLHGYQEPARTGRFFAVLRTGWHVALIAYFLGAQRWLSAHPGDFGPLFGVGWALGALRLAMIRRLPERSERSDQRIRAREAIALLRDQPLLRSYLLGCGLAIPARAVAFAFALVLLRREIGMSDGQILWTTIAVYTGGLLSLQIFGRIVDAVGPAPVFRWTAIGQAILVLALFGVRDAGAASLALAVAAFFLAYGLGAGFDVADTYVLFSLAPSHAPARTMVVVQVTESAVRAAAPLVAGVVLERALAAGIPPLAAYRALFAACAVLTLAALLPLRAVAQIPSSAARS